MPQVHYPFIDIAVHPAVRTHFAAGDAVVLFSRDMRDVLWANGEGARLFGHREIYDLLETGPERGGVAFRQLAAAAAQLSLPGDKRGFMMRITSGFKSTAVQAAVDLIVVGRDNAVMFSATPASGSKTGLSALLSGFDDDDTHMAVLGGDGDVLASSAGFSHLGVTPDTARALISAAARSGEGLVKRPISSGSGYLPAAIGRLSDQLYLLFCVETSIGSMDAPEDRQEPIAADPAAVVEPVAEFLHEPEVASAVDEQYVEDAVEIAVASDAFVEDSSSTDMPLTDAPATDEAAGEPSEFIHSDVDTQTEATASIESEVEETVSFSDEGEVEEGEAEDDVGDLAAIDGASPEEIEAASSPVAATDENAEASDELHTEEQASEPRLNAPTELAADIAEASIDGEDAALSDVGSSELAADIAVATDLDTQVPEEFHETHPVTDDLTETEAVIAEPSDAEPVASLQGIESSELAGDLADASADAEEAPEEYRVAQPEAEQIAAAESVSEPLQAIDEEPVVATESVNAHAAAQPFHFDGGARPVRFVWKLDANGAFAEVSDEFSRTVGPRSGDIVGQSFRDLASRFDLDPEQQITVLLDRRDTWSGRTIKWPVEGTDLVVPVDLAALPTYSRNREFDGFRGFGIIRVGDAETDPHGFGLSLLPEDAPTADAAPPEADETTADAEALTDEFRGEVPALDIVSNPLAAFSDKIIQLEERRARNTRDGLSASEQAALKEIARQLEPFGKRPNEDILKSTSGLLQTDDVDDASDHEFDGQDDDRSVVDGDDGSFFDDLDRDDRLDEQSVQTLFEDLGTGPGLTAYAIDQVPMAILIHAGDRLIEANGEFRRLTGYATITDLEREGGLDALITRREGPDAGVYLVRADGTQVLVSARLQSVRYEGSSALMLALTPAAGSIAAVTTEPQIIGESDVARKMSALKVEVDELHSILETATDGVIVLDTEGRIRSMNRSAAALFNFDDKDTLGKPFAMLFAHESQKSVQDYLAGLAGHGVASVLNDGREVIGREASGGFIPLFMTMGRMPGSNSYCAVIRDITQWKRSEEELRTAKRAAETANQHKSDFLARVSHEIRTPLNAIIGFSDMIANEHFGPAGHSRYVEYASDIGRSGRHVLDIVNDLLDISKIEAGEMDLEFAAVGINDCISEAVSLVQPQANAQRVIIRTSLSQSVPDVVADLRSIKQIALNILANAIRYTPSGGQIVVSTAYEQSGSVTLRIRDTGVGMSKAELDQAMKPFGQVASGTRQRGDGTGLGLPLTKAMTEANRATFAIHSAPNEGTLVEITFPPQRVLAD